MSGFDNQLTGLPYELVWTQAEDREADRAYYEAWGNDIAQFLKRRRLALTAYADACDAQGLVMDDVAYEACESLCVQMEARLKALRVRIKGDVLQGLAYYRHVSELERAYQVLVRLKFAVVEMMTWASPVYAQSGVAVAALPLRGESMEERMLNRPASPEMQAWGAQLKQVLGVGEGYGLIGTASGTAAFTLVFQALMQARLTAGFKVYVPRVVIGGNDLQVDEGSLLYSVVCEDSTDEEVIAARAVALQADVVLLEGMRDTEMSPMLDLLKLVGILNSTQLEKDMYLLVDDTLLGGAYVVAEHVTNPRVKVYQYTNAIKYLQLGLDLWPAGTVVVAKAEEDFFRKWASLLGLGLRDTVAAAYPTFDREQYVWRQRRQTRNACVMAQILEKRFGQTGLKVFYPLLEGHPQFEKALKLPFVGALVTLDVSAVAGQVSRKNMKPLMVILDKLLGQAQRQGLSIAASESFGLGTPRVTVNWCKRTKPYIRISVGDRSMEETLAIANLIADELLRLVGGRA